MSRRRDGGRSGGGRGGKGGRAGGDDPGRGAGGARGGRGPSGADDPGRGPAGPGPRGGGRSGGPPSAGPRGVRAGHGDDAPREDVLYGRNPVAEALRAGRREVRDVWVTAAAAREPWLEGVRHRIVEADAIAARAGSEAHQGVCALAAPYPYADASALLRLEAPLIVALDEVQDVQNLGAIVRTAECAGAAGVVIPERRSADVTAAAAKASAGAVEHLPVARCRNLADWLAEAKEAGCWVYGAVAGPGSVPYDEPDYAGGVVLVLGAEGKGLRPRVAGACDALVELPLRGRMESLNVSAAAAALLYGILQRRLRG